MSVTPKSNLGSSGDIRVPGDRCLTFVFDHVSDMDERGSKFDTVVSCGNR